MTVLRAIVEDDRVIAADRDAILDAVATLRPGQPVTLMVHGYRYSPRRRAADPGRSLYATGPSQGPDFSWPRHLGYRSGAAPGLAIGLAWDACGTLGAAHRGSGPAGAACAALVTAMRAAAPAVRINAIGHSLGARVILHALARLPSGHLSRTILLAAAAFQADAAAALSGPSGQTTEIVNITSRENDLFDVLAEWALGPGVGRTIGEGLKTPGNPPDPGRPQNWLDLQIDNAEVLRHLRRLGFPVAAAHRRICHWSAYSRPGIFSLYRALLTDRCPLPLTALAATVRLPQDPRWSRLRGRQTGALGLPFRLGAPS